MASIARSSLRHESRRYLAAVLSVTFAGLLMVVQVALLQGLFRTISLPIDMSRADLLLGFPGADSADQGRGVSRHADAAARIHPAVLRVEALASTGGDLRRADGQAQFVFINVIDASPEGIAFARMLSPAQRALLDEPDNLLVDEADLDKLGNGIGAIAEVNGKRVRIAGTVRGLRGVGGVNMLASFETGRRIDGTVRRDEPQNFLIALRPGADVQQVMRELADPSASPRWEVREAREYSAALQNYWLFETGMGIGAGFGALLALIVGAVVTSQTLAAAVLASIKEFAALRALGVPRARLRFVVLELAGWVGLVGLALTAVLAVGFVALARSQHVAVHVSPATAVATVVMILLVTLVSGLIALRPLFRADPASLLR